MTMKRSQGGYRLDIMRTNIQPKFLCCLCNLILRDPTQGSCGHIFCKNCIYEYLSPNNKTLCPACEEEETIEDSSFLHLDQIFPDKGKKRELNELPVKCPNADCDWEGQLKFLMTHEIECPYQVVEAPEVKNDSLQAAVSETIGRLESRLSAFQFTLSDTSARENLQRQMAEIKKRLKVLEWETEEHNIEAVYSLEQIVENLIQKMQTNEEAINVFHHQMQICIRCMARLKLLSQQSESTIEEQKKTIKTIISEVEGAEKLLVAQLDAVASMGARLEQLERNNYDGTLLWRITDFRKRREDAINGTITSLYSPPFFTSRQGYKMRALIYLNGDGIGLETHISVFFLIMRGDYDAVLTWPFRHRVTFLLLDKNHVEHVIDTLQPDPASQSFKRPTSEMNIASGCPLFLSQKQLEANAETCIQDDTLFVKICVETDNEDAMDW